MDCATGVKDVDVWLFFEEAAEVKIPHVKDIRKSRKVLFTRLGIKRVNFMKKLIPPRFISAASRVEAIANYVTQSRNGTAAHLVSKPIIGLHPKELFGVVIWAPLGAMKSPVRSRER